MADYPKDLKIRRQGFTIRPAGGDDERTQFESGYVKQSVLLSKTRYIASCTSFIPVDDEEDFRKWTRGDAKRWFDYDGLDRNRARILSVRLISGSLQLNEGEVGTMASFQLEYYE